MPSNRLFLTVILLSGTVACGKAEPPKPAAVTAAGPQAAMSAEPQGSSAAAAPGGAGSLAATSHAPSAPAAPASAPTLMTVTGAIVETMDSGGYTYMKLKLKDGTEQWAAVNQSPVKKGQTVTVANAMPMDGFESKTLKRRFDRILFGMLEGQAPAAGAAPGMAGAPGMPPGDVKAQMAAQHAGVTQAADVGKIDVPRAEGKDGKRVAEVFAERAALADKSVSIRAKVVKFTPGVMGRNWVHLRDGSGSAEKKDNDLTVTTKDAAAVGDTVVVKGKVGLDRDFGMGYAYPVLIEEASVARQ